ncbi:hypothetical protein EYF80_028530 [Liparis tanakae]|uniref:Uncharacterized protein n=1 Tax=Liparis tanakae TaxID=230148 RepID=A0A4Z2H7M6_9TELE|nr:hypothetical protein EYF80_028530 [Liparis tanakae]
MTQCWGSCALEDPWQSERLWVGPPSRVRSVDARVGRRAAAPVYRRPVSLTLRLPKRIEKNGPLVMLRAPQRGVTLASLLLDVQPNGNLPMVVLDEFQHGMLL